MWWWATSKEKERIMAEIQVKSIGIPASLDPTILGRAAIRYKTAMKKELDRELEIQGNMFRKTVRTWRHPVIFRKKIIDTPNLLTGYIGTDDRIYKFLAFGTKVRYATMSKSFRPKTKVRYIGSTAGAGNPDPLFVSKRVPRPGIEARLWVDEIFDRRSKYFIKNFTQISFTFWQREWKKMLKGAKSG